MKGLKELNITNFIKCGINEIKPLLEEYLRTLTGVVDDFWEEHIITADIYAIRENEQPIGCFTIHGQNKITMFYVQSAYIRFAQDIFKRF